MEALEAQTTNKERITKLVDDLSKDYETVIIVAVGKDDQYNLGVQGNPAHVILNLERTIDNVVKHVSDGDSKSRRNLMKAVSKHITMLAKED